MCPSANTIVNVGERIPESTKYCYPDYRKTTWLPLQCQQLEELIDPLSEIDQEEWQSIKKNLAKEIGFKGTSILHRLHPLYGFDLTKDFVIDLQHGLPLNPVKHEFEALLNLLDADEDSMSETGRLNTVQAMNDSLDSFPWSSGMMIYVLEYSYI